MGLDIREIYGFPRYPMTEETQTVEQDIKKAATEGVSDDIDPRMKKLAKEKKFEPLDETIEVEIEFEAEESEETGNPKEKLDKAINETKADVETPDSYFQKHLVESLSSEDPGMMALGLDCLKEVVGLLCEEKRTLIKNSWEKYFKEDNEFSQLEDGKASNRLKDIFKSEVLPLMMGPAKKKMEKKEF